jgi:Xaa-Pro aminopeptidase
MIPANEFEQRRLRLLTLMEPLSVMVLFSGVEKIKSADENYPFEVNRNFYYLTGIDQPDSILVLINSDGDDKEFLFIAPFDERKEKWYGKRLKTEEAQNLSGLNNVLVNSNLAAKVDEVLNPTLATYGEIKRVYLDLDREIKIADSTSTKEYKDTLAAVYPGLTLGNAYPLITTLRLKKSVREIAELQSAIASTHLGLAAIWAAAKPGMKEYELADVFAKAVNDDNSYQGLSFPTIMASGIHAACLHYPTPRDVIPEGSLLLMDLGARNSYYCADVTRTIPVSGRFNDVQRAVYGIVLGCNKMVAAMARPGITIDDLQKAAVEYLSSECVAKGFLKVKDDLAKYYFHNVSHFIGLDTHDPYLDPLSPDYKKVPLEAGMIISDEPGLYMADRALGVRIEDDLLITDTGCQVLTSDIVKEIDVLESRLASAHQ